MDQIQIAQQQFGELIKSELERIERMKLDTEIKDFSKLYSITVGILPGDGVGPILMKQALRVLEDLMAPEIASGRLVIRQIEGMTIERRADLMQSLPDDVFQACKECDVLVRGRPLAQPGLRQQPTAPRARPLRRRAPHPHAGQGHRLDLLP